MNDELSFSKRMANKGREGDATSFRIANTELCSCAIMADMVYIRQRWLETFSTSR